MLADFVKAIVGLGQDARSVEILESQPLGPRKVLLRVGGELVERDVPPPARDPHLLSLDDIIRFVGDVESEAEVYHSDQWVTAMLDVDDRREFARMSLTPTDRWKTLRDLREWRSFTVAEAVKLLRHDLAGDGVDPVLQGIRRVDFVRNAAGHQAADHGRSSLGKSVEAAVQRADEIPTEFAVSSSVYSQPGVVQFAATVRVGIHLDLDAERIQLRAMPDELDQAVAAVHRQLQEALTNAFACPVYYGSP